MKFEEQSFVVTGAARAKGIGLNFVQQLLANGVQKIAVFDIADPNETINKLKEQFSDRNILFHRVDVRNKFEIETAFQKVVKSFGYVDVLVNVAAIWDELKIEQTLRVNLFGVIQSTLIAVDHMSLKKGGRGGMIVNVSSVAGLDPEHRCPVYSSTKFGVVGFTRALSDKELASELGIKFVIICPGGTETGMFQSTLTNLFGAYNIDEEFKRLRDQYGTQTPEECAKNMIQAMKESKNGSAWILDRAKHIPVQFPQHFNPKL